jgi:hypothetical protein
MQPSGEQSSSGAQHSQPKRQAVVPGAHTKGSHAPSTQAWQRPQLGTHALGSHW